MRSRGAGGGVAVVDGVSDLDTHSDSARVGDREGLRARLDILVDGEALASSISRWEDRPRLCWRISSLGSCSRWNDYRSLVLLYLIRLSRKKRKK